MAVARRVGSCVYREPVVMFTLICYFSVVLATQQEKKVYRVTVKEEMPYIFQKPGSKEGPYNFEGLLVDLLDRMAEILDIKFSLNHVGDDKFGERENDGTWTGMIGELQRNESDIAAGPLTVTADRAKIVDFSQPFSSSGLRILIKKPEVKLKTSDSFELFIRPFSVGVWIILLATSGTFSLLRYLNRRFNPKEKRHSPDLESFEYEYHVSLSGRPDFSSVITKGGRNVIHTSRASSILHTSSSFFVLSSITIYIAQLTSIIIQTSSDEKQYLPFVTFNGLLTHEGTQYNCLDKHFACEYFHSSSQSLEKSINKYLLSRKNSRFSSVKTATQNIRKNTRPHALILESDFAYYIASQEPCDLIVVGEELGDLSHSFACRPGLGICRDLDIAILTLKSTGELGQIREKWLSGPCGKYSDMVSPYSHANEVAFHTKFTLDNERTVKSFLIPLVLTYGGICIGICVMLWEIYRPRSKLQWNPTTYVQYFGCVASKIAIFYFSFIASCLFSSLHVTLCKAKTFRVEYHDHGRKLTDSIEVESGSDVIK